jgi:hypothetical protein
MAKILIIILFLSFPAHAASRAEKEQQWREAAEKGLITESHDGWDFLGVRCIGECRGELAGYLWATDNYYLYDPQRCMTQSSAFNVGCLIYFVKETEKLSEQISNQADFCESNDYVHQDNLFDACQNQDSDGGWPYE